MERVYFCSFKWHRNRNRHTHSHTCTEVSKQAVDSQCQLLRRKCNCTKSRQTGAQKAQQYNRKKKWKYETNIEAAEICNEDKCQKYEWFASKITPYYFSCEMIFIFTKIEIATSARRLLSVNIECCGALLLSFNFNGWTLSAASDVAAYLTHVDSRSNISRL